MVSLQARHQYDLQWSGLCYGFYIFKLKLSQTNFLLTSSTKLRSVQILLLDVGPKKAEETRISFGPASSRGKIDGGSSNREHLFGSPRSSSLSSVKSGWCAAMLRGTLLHREGASTWEDAVNAPILATSGRGGATRC